MTDEGLKPRPARGTKRSSSSAFDGSIWDSVSGLADNPILQVGIELAKENFQFCLSRRYGTVNKKTTPNHLETVMGLGGSFAVDEENKYPGSYATSRVLSKEGVTGIFFNKNLADRAKSLGEDYMGQANAPERMAKNVELVGLVAVIQQTVEHEVGHMKYHLEGIDDLSFVTTTLTKKDENFKEDTRTETSLDGEAGYAVQRQVHQDFFGSTDSSEPSIITLNEDGVVASMRQFSKIPYTYQLARIVNEHGMLVSRTAKKKLSIKDIEKLMDYPKKGECDMSVHPPSDGDRGVLLAAMDRTLGMTKMTLMAVVAVVAASPEVAVGVVAASPEVAEQPQHCVKSSG